MNHTKHTRVARIVPAALATLLGCAWFATASGCIIIADGSSYNDWNDDVVKETRVTSAEHIAGKPLNVRSFNGSVTVHKGGTDKVQITANIRARTNERLAAVQIRTERGGDGTLVIEPIFPENKHKGSEGCSFDILVPDAMGVQVTTSNGSVDVEGMAGRAILASSNGAITLSSHDGPAELDTSNGTIKTSNVKGDISAESSNGAIHLAGVTAGVKAETSNGGINCDMAPDAPGPVKLDTSNGSIVLGIGPGFGGNLVADTSNAAVTVVNVTSESSNVSKGHATLKFKNPGGKSVLDTSNGSIKIKGAG